MNNIAYIINETSITYSQFFNDIFKARLSLAKNPAKRVMLFDNNCYRFSVFFFALMLEKREIVLPPNSQDETLQSLSLTCDATIGCISIKSKPNIDINFDIQVGSDTIPCCQLFEGLQGNLIFYTSGTSGQHKPIKKNYTELVNEIAVLSDTFPNLLKPKTLIISTVSHQHIYGLLFKVLLPLKNSLSIVANTFEYPEHIATYLSHLPQEQRVTIISSPAHLKRWVNDNVLIPFKPYLNGLFSSGGPLSKETSDLINQQLGNFPIEILGSTETGGMAWRQNQSLHQSSWLVFNGISFSSSDDGRLIITSPFIAKKTYRSDDLINKVNEQRFQLLGRADRTIKLEEKRVNLTDIEQCLLNHSWVKDVRILVIENKGINKRKVLGAVIELSVGAQEVLINQGKRHISEEFKQSLLGQFERISLPKKWRYLASLPYNTQGKLPLKELEALFV